MQKIKKKEKWVKQELELLGELYPQFISKKWKQIAQKFREKGFHRSEIECREKWVNYLDPDLKTQDWEDSELQKLFQIHDQVGTKWCVIQKYIGRTQNKIKNRFYGTLRNYVRFVMNFLEESDKSFNYEVGKLSPKFLNDMYKAQNQFRFLNDEIRDSIFGMKFKIDRDALSERIKQKKSLYQRLKCLILKTFNGFRSQVRAITPQPELPIQPIQQAFLIKKEESGSVQHLIEINQEIKHPALKQEESVEANQIQQEAPQLENYYPFLNYQFSYPFWIQQNNLYWQ